jgi:tetratricopeptide (TPR) repeat protein
MNDNLPELERLEDALKQHDQILQAEPNNYQAWHIRGHILGKLNRYEESIASYDQALAIKVDDVASWYERGYISSYLDLNIKHSTL